MLLQRTSPVPRCSACCLQTSALLQPQYIYQGITGFIDSRAARTRLLLEVARQRPVQALALRQCRRRPNQPMLMAPAEAHREARSTRQSPTAKTKAVEDLEAQSPKFPLNLNQIQKCSSRTKASVEALTANRSQKQVGSYLICKIEYSSRIFRMSWFRRPGISGKIC